MGQNCSSGSHLAPVTQRGWLLFGLEVDPDVERRRRTGRRKDGMEGGGGEKGRWGGGVGSGRRENRSIDNGRRGRGEDAYGWTGGLSILRCVYVAGNSARKDFLWGN